MMKRLDISKTLYKKDVANLLAAKMTAIEAKDVDGWTYVANHNPTGRGWSFVEIFDEDGVLVGTL